MHLILLPQRECIKDKKPTHYFLWNHIYLFIFQCQKLKHPNIISVFCFYSHALSCSIKLCTRRLCTQGTWRWPWTSPTLSTWQSLTWAWTSAGCCTPYRWVASPPNTVCQAPQQDFINCFLTYVFYNRRQWRRPSLCPAPLMEWTLWVWWFSPCASVWSLATWSSRDRPSGTSLTAWMKPSWGWCPSSSGQ